MPAGYFLWKAFSLIVFLVVFLIVNDLPSLPLHFLPLAVTQRATSFEPGSGGGERAAARRAAGVTVERALRVDGVQLVKLAPGESQAAAIARLERDPAVAFAEPNRVRTTQATVPNDPQFFQLWGMDSIDAPEAWDLRTGGDTLVAVVDEGVAYDHPDLDGNIWRNPGEISGNGVDDDGNGYKDDLIGYDFVGTGDNNPRGSGSHGTHVAGTIAAEGNNGTGVTGVSWTARMMVLRVLNSAGQGSDADIAEAFDYAGDMGARVVNASLGGPGDSAALRVPITTHPDTLYVVAAGNDGTNNELGDGNYPCNYPDLNVICVASTTQGDGLSSFSNFGSTSVDLGAPGSNIYSTVPGGSGYGFLSGTSMATPHVSGALALLFAHKPALTAPQACASILDTGDPAAALAGKTQTGRRLNVNNALRTDQPPVASTGAASSVTQTAATLGGAIASRCTATTWLFEYGQTQAYGSTTSLTNLVNRANGISAAITGLAPATTYHYRLVGIRGTERFPGADATFTTAAGTRTNTSTQGGTPPPATPPGTTPPPVQTESTPSLATLARQARVTCTRVRRTIRCRVTKTTRAVRIRLVLKRRGRLVARAAGLSGNRITIKVKGGKPKLGRYTVTLTVLENDDRATTTKRIRIR